MLRSVALPSDADWRRVAEATWRRREDGRLHFDWDVRLAEPLRQGTPLPDVWELFRSLRQVPVLALRRSLVDILSPATFPRLDAPTAEPRCGNDRVINGRSGGSA